jgi:hypothetical protein
MYSGFRLLIITAQPLHQYWRRYKMGATDDRDTSIGRISSNSNWGVQSPVSAYDLLHGEPCKSGIYYPIYPLTGMSYVEKVRFCGTVRQNWRLQRKESYSSSKPAISDHLHEAAHHSYLNACSVAVQRNQLLSGTDI